jgi:hypothetical protein
MMAEKPRKIPRRIISALRREGVMRGPRNRFMAAGLGAAGLALALPAMAASPEGGRYVWVPGGVTVVLLPSGPTLETAPADVSLVGMFARQDAMVRQMLADMNALMNRPMPEPQEMLRSITQDIPAGIPGAGVVITSITTGAGTCSQTITYGSPTSNGQPRMTVSNSGNACGAIAAPTGQTVIAPDSVPVPSAAPQQRVWDVNYPAQPVRTARPQCG